MNLRENNMAGDIVYVDENNIPTEYLTWIEIPESALIKQSYAVNGYSYDLQKQIFIPPQPYPSWTFDENFGNWKAPVAYPEDSSKMWMWDENLQSWY